MNDERIVIEISADGRTVTVEGKDFAGADCKNLTAAIEGALGTVKACEIKPEYFQERTHGRTVAR